MKVDKTLILNKIQRHYDFKKDSDFAKFLGITTQVLSNWKARSTFDIEILYTKCLDISPDFMITGNEPILKKNTFDSEDANEMFNKLKEPKFEYQIENKIVQAQQKTIEVLEKNNNFLQHVIDQYFQEHK